MPKTGVLSRRRFLLFLTAPAAIAQPVISHQSSAISQSLLPGVGKPEFWFGDRVQFRWIDETTGESHSECGEVVGVVRNFAEARWEYRVNWTSSTAYPNEDYPVYDGSLWTTDVLSKVMR